jgi:hypothetical protein
VQNIDPNKYHIVSLPIVITVNVTEVFTGVKQIELFYRYSPNGEDWKGWTLYGINTTSEPYYWLFHGQNGTGYYELYSIATSNGGIIEDIPTEEDVCFSVYPIWDVSMDGQVNVLDLICVVKYWGENNNGHKIPEDVNNDGIVNILDLIILGQYWDG